MPFYMSKRVEVHQRDAPPAIDQFQQVMFFSHSFSQEVLKKFQMALEVLIGFWGKLIGN